MTALKELLEDIARQAKVYDVTERAVVGGRRRRRLRQTAGAGVVAAIVVVTVVGLVAVYDILRPQPKPPITSNSPTVAPSPSPPVGPTLPTNCVAERLPVPRGHPVNSVVSGGDPSGRFVIGRSYPDPGEDRVLIWDNGKVRTIAMPGSDPTLRDITSTGMAVGTSFITIGGAEHQVAWAYRDGSMSRLRGVDADATAVNENGVIVGMVKDKPVVWRNPSAEPEFLPVPNGWRGIAWGVDEDGTIVGRLWKPATEYDRAFAWLPDGTARELLPTFTINGSPANSANAFSIRNGWVGGTAELVEEQGTWIHVVRWNLRTGEPRALHPDLGYTRIVNAHGWMAGEGQLGLVLVSEQESVVLPGIEGQIENYQHVESVSDDGRVLAGYVGIGEITPVAVMWRCH